MFLEPKERRTAFRLIVAMQLEYGRDSWSPAVVIAWEQWQQDLDA
jgi:hypothetical protein